MEILKADLSQVTLEHMEAEPEIIKILFHMLLLLTVNIIIHN